MTSWANTVVAIDIVRGSLNLDDGLFLFVTNDSGLSNAAGFAMNLDPNATLNFADDLTLLFDASFTVLPARPIDSKRGGVGFKFGTRM